MDKKHPGGISWEFPNFFLCTCKLSTNAGKTGAVVCMTTSVRVYICTYIYIYTCVAAAPCTAILSAMVYVVLMATAIVCCDNSVIAAQPYSFDAYACVFDRCKHVPRLGFCWFRASLDPRIPSH